MADTTTQLNVFLTQLAAGVIAITDGVTPPAAKVGVAQIYVDITGGALKVIFGNGTVKTITTNP